MSDPDDLTVVFRTHSDIEARVVQGLLESHDVETMLASGVPHTVVPVAVSGPGEVRIAVRSDRAGHARRLISEFREDVSAQVGKVRDSLQALERSLGYRFRDQGLLEHALTHRSHAHEDASGGVLDNESLEFLGDAVLGLVISDRLFREWPASTEGEKSKAKARLVSARTLAALGEQLGLGSHLLLGRGEEKTGGRRKRSLIADGFEAVVAAIYLDGGFSAATAFIDRQFRSALDEVLEGRVVSGVVADHKSALQEWLQANGRPLPDYRLAAERGPDHQKVFTVELRVGSQAVSRAEGPSKKEAEQKAAARALESLTSS